MLPEDHQGTQCIQKNMRTESREPKSWWHVLFTWKSVNYVPCLGVTCTEVSSEGVLLTSPTLLLAIPHPTLPRSGLPSPWELARCYSCLMACLHLSLAYKLLENQQYVSPGIECIFTNCVFSEKILNYFLKDCISIENDGLLTVCISLGSFPMWSMSYYMATWARVSPVRPLVILQPAQQQGPWAQRHRTLVCGSGRFLTCQNAFFFFLELDMEVGPGWHHGPPLSKGGGVRTAL